MPWAAHLLVLPQHLHGQRLCCLVSCLAVCSTGFLLGGAAFDFWYCDLLAADVVGTSVGIEFAFVSKITSLSNLSLKVVSVAASASTLAWCSALPSPRE